MFEALTSVRTAEQRMERSSNFELFAWLFMRVSGIILLVIALGHLFYMHFVVGVTNIDFALIAERWENPFWRIYDTFLLFFAFTHGTNGMRYIIDDYFRGGVRVTLKLLLYLLYFALMVMGTYVIVTFRV
nr:hypothetical protein [Ardenticatena sp.]